MNKSVFMKVPRNVADGLDDNYTKMLVDSQEDIVKRGIRTVFEEFYTRAEAKDEHIMALPHPIRKRWVGMMPIHIELLLEETESVALILSAFSKPYTNLSTLIDKLVDVSKSFREFAKVASNDGSGANLGHIGASIFPHLYFAKGAKHYKLDDNVTALIHSTLLSESSPIGFMKMPLSNVFIECSPNLFIDNPESGLHNVDGFYVNQYVIDGDIVSEEWDLEYNRKASGTINRYMANKGLFSKNGGSIRVFEVLVVGRPKDNVMDDAMLSFCISIQDDTKSIKEVIDAHIEYYTIHQKANATQLKHEIEYKNATKEQGKEIAELVSFLTKTLLILFSNEIKSTRNLPYTDAMNQYNSVKSAFMKRKAERRAKITYDHNFIQLNQ